MVISAHAVAISALGAVILGLGTVISVPGVEFLAKLAGLQCWYISADV